MATFNGLDLGLVFEMNTEANPVALQINAYCGANGLQVIRQGSRGGRTTASGALLAAGDLALAAYEQAFISLMVNAGAYLLIDRKGKPWPGVILTSFRTVGKTYQSVGFARGLGRTQKYEAEFLHIL